MLFSGYWNEGAWELGDKATGLGYVKTGDLGVRDSNGLLYLVGRIDGGVKLPNGITVYPQDLESRIKKYHSDVEDVAISVIDRGDMTAVLVMRQSPSWEPVANTPQDQDQDPEIDRASKLLEEVLVWSTKDLIWYQRPARFMVVRKLDFPYDATGKSPDHAKLDALHAGGALHATALATS